MKGPLLVVAVWAIVKFAILFWKVLELDGRVEKLEADKKDNTK